MPQRRSPCRSRKEPRPAAPESWGADLGGELRGRQMNWRCIRTRRSRSAMPDARRSWCRSRGHTPPPATSFQRPEAWRWRRGCMSCAWPHAGDLEGLFAGGDGCGVAHGVVPEGVQPVGMHLGSGSPSRQHSTAPLIQVRSRRGERRLSGAHRLPHVQVQRHGTKSRHHACTPTVPRVHMKTGPRRGRSPDSSTQRNAHLTAAEPARC
jgi:hypothetical protein